MTTQFKSICTRCGAGIKNVCIYQGKHYGTTCVQLVSGLTWDLLSYVRNNQGQDLDLDKYAQQLEQQKAEEEQKEKELEERNRAIKQENAWLRDVLYQNYGRDIKGDVDFDSQFIADMYMDLEFFPFPDLSEKQKDILMDIYAKSFGRRNSKKYDKAYNYAFDIAY